MQTSYEVSDNIRPVLAAMSGPLAFIWRHPYRQGTIFMNDFADIIIDSSKLHGVEGYYSGMKDQPYVFGFALR